MSEPTPPAATPAPPPPPPAPPQRRQIVIVSHSTLFYWWPVWAVGFFMTALSFFGDRMAVLPRGTELHENIKIEVADAKGNKTPTTRDVLALPEKVSGKLHEPKLHIATTKNAGVVFVAVLLLVIVITNIPLRGLWSFVVILLIVFLTILFAVMELWATIFHWFGFLDIRINMAGYFVISSVLFVLWLLVFVFFDRQIYMVFEPGQLRVRQAIGDAETTYDTTGMTTMKQRSDLFRHWILGIGSGDLVVKTSGANATEIHMNNVLFIGYKHAEIEELLRSRQVMQQ